VISLRPRWRVRGAYPGLVSTAPENGALDHPFGGREERRRSSNVAELFIYEIRRELCEFWGLYSMVAAKL